MRRELGSTIINTNLRLRRSGLVMGSWRRVGNVESSGEDLGGKGGGRMKKESFPKKKSWKVTHEIHFVYQCI